ncbi:hypothetical protein J1614_001146 [Plenodomus biglobosus]|nr:hypothetical protein J1614_001146 [Plenodomus biglobosus]
MITTASCDRDTKLRTRPRVHMTSIVDMHKDLVPPICITPSPFAKMKLRSQFAITANSKAVYSILTRL